MVLVHGHGERAAIAGGGARDRVSGQLAYQDQHVIGDRQPSSARLTEQPGLADLIGVPGRTRVSAGPVP